MQAEAARRLTAEQTARTAALQESVPLPAAQPSTPPALVSQRGERSRSSPRSPATLEGSPAVAAIPDSPTRGLHPARERSRSRTEPPQRQCRSASSITPASVEDSVAFRDFLLALDRERLAEMAFFLWCIVQVMGGGRP